ncbi:MAG TPA: DUF72 domain-containing protein [Kofleriaceae bacterium]|jgi:uncharacterized protein YecE (DUF72 family)
MTAPDEEDIDDLEESDDSDEESDEEEIVAGDDIDTRIGTADLPDRMDRAKYFKSLTYLEMSGMFAGPLKPSVIDKWAASTPKGTLGIVAPWVLTHRKPPKAEKLWQSDNSVGDFRSSSPGKVALAALADAVGKLGAAHAIFRSPPLFAASQANRDALAKFFGEFATEEAVGAPRVWIPDGIWDVRTAVKLANELGVLCAFDPLVRDPGQPPEVYYDLGVPALFLRITGLGRSGPIRPERLEDLVMLLEHYEDTPATVVFESPSKWQDARNLRKVLASEI